jgi:transcriptional regulator with XRE-family HTH domain
MNHHLPNSSKIKRNESALALIRKALGITQEEMGALFLKNRAHYAMVETSRRELPDVEMLRFIELYQLVKAVEIPPPALPTDAEKNEVINELIADFKRTIQRIDETMKKEEEEREQNIRLAEVLHNIDKISAIPGSKPESDASWKSMMEYRVRNKTSAKSEWKKSIQRNLEKKSLLDKIQKLEEMKTA